MRLRNVSGILVGLSVLASASGAGAQEMAFPPGSFAIDGVPVQCGGVTYVVTPRVADVGMARPDGVILLNPVVLAGSSTSIKLFWAAHECGHFVEGTNESGADCWAVRAGRDQGWFPPEAFAEMVQMFRNNPGDSTHAPGFVRLQRMVACYQAP